MQDPSGPTLGSKHFSGKHKGIQANMNPHTDLIIILLEAVGDHVGLPEHCFNSIIGGRGGLVPIYHVHMCLLGCGGRPATQPPLHSQVIPGHLCSTLVCYALISVALQRIVLCLVACSVV